VAGTLLEVVNHYGTESFMHEYAAMVGQLDVESWKYGQPVISKSIVDEVLQYFVEPLAEYCPHYNILQSILECGYSETEAVAEAKKLLDTRRSLIVRKV